MQSQPGRGPSQRGSAVFPFCLLRLCCAADRLTSLSRIMRHVVAFGYDLRASEALDMWGCGAEFATPRTARRGTAWQCHIPRSLREDCVCVASGVKDTPY